MKKIFAILMMALACSVSAQTPDEIATTLVKLNETVPDFKFTDEGGKTVSITELRGKTVMITFFATWCGPCRSELPHIQSEIYNQYKDNSKFRLLIFGREHTAKEVAEFKAGQSFTMPFYADKDRSVYGLFAKQFIPRNFLIDTNGKIIFSSVGFAEKDFSALKELIAKKLNE